MSGLKDKWNRRIRYLRLSVTDRCNYRCSYCMPVHEYKCEDTSILSFEDMLFLSRCLSQMGVVKLRLTGGEPLVRKDIAKFIHELNRADIFKDIALTTNGSLLHIHGKDIYDAGVKRLNISLDSLKSHRYQEITGRFHLEQVLNNIDYARDLGFSPIKVNVVVAKSFNVDEVLDFCDFAASSGVNVRFIELMPFSEAMRGDLVTGPEIMEIIRSKHQIEPVVSTEGSVARDYSLSNGAKVSFIMPFSSHFCHECDKLRVTADGKLRTCLLKNYEHDISDAIASGDASFLKSRITAALDEKGYKHDIAEAASISGRSMKAIGG